MPEPEERGSETEKLAGTLNGLIWFLDGIAGIVLSILRGCLWCVLAYVGLLVTAFVIGFAYDSIAARIGDRLTLLLLIAAAWAIIARWRRSRRRGGGPPT